MTYVASALEFKIYACSLSGVAHELRFEEASCIALDFFEASCSSSRFSGSVRQSGGLVGQVRLGREQA